MKHAYCWARPLLAALFLLLGLGAYGQQFWRPFRPGLVYTYADPTPGSTPRAHTLRVDSAYATAAGDSVYAFNRVLRTATSNIGQPYYYRSRNNLFGARMRWRPGTAEFFLETNAEPLNTASATSVRLLPRMPVGSTWSASTQPALTATLSSRILSTIGGAPDSVVTITLSNGQLIRLSRQLGLLEGPQWLGLTGASTTPTPSWTASKVPQTFAQSPYNPLTLFAMQPGDEFGYEWYPLSLYSYQCDTGVILRRFLTRQQTADSLIFTFQEQMRTQTSGWPGCYGTPGTNTRPMQLKRWAFSLRTGKSAQFPALPLLTSEYVPDPSYSAAGALLMGLGLFDTATNGSATVCPTPVQIRYQRVYASLPNTPGGYLPGIDHAGWQQAFGVASAVMPGINGLGDLQTYDVGLRYVRRTLPGTATIYTCGPSANFTGLLLATRAGQAAALATLAPNPAAETATLTLAQPVRAGHTVRLTDALGRQVWSAPVPTGQTAVAVPLAGQPAGLYLLHLNSADGTAASWKLVHE